MKIIAIDSGGKSISNSDGEPVFFNSKQKAFDYIEFNYSADEDDIELEWTFYTVTEKHQYVVPKTKGTFKTIKL